jgi:signal transduction histidine kinase
MIVVLLREWDIATAREGVRQTGLALGFAAPDLRLVEAVASEMCLHALSLGCPVDLSITALNRTGRAGISMVMRAPFEITEREFQNDEHSPGLRLPGAKRLSDHWEISIRNGKTTVHAIKWRPDSAPAGLAKRYLQVIETAPQKAWEFGRQAVLDGFSLTAIAALHAETMKHVSCPPQAQQCFEEVLAAFEMVYRGFSEARTSINGIHELLELQAERIAQSLHDEAEQALAVLSLEVDGLECGEEVCAAQALRLKAMVEEAGNLFRTLSHELRPPLLEDEGLAAALLGLCDSFSSRRRICVEFRDDLKRRLDPPLERAMYRTVQTALANVVRHAGATQVLVRIFASGASIFCAVRDNGRGLDPEQLRSPGLGLRGVGEWAAALGGTVELELVQPHGLEIRIRLPDSSTLFETRS